MTGSLTEIIERYKSYPSPRGMRIIPVEFQVEIYRNLLTNDTSLKFIKEEVENHDSFKI
jgi:hypothetical protein